MERHIAGGSPSVPAENRGLFKYAQGSSHSDRLGLTQSTNRTIGFRPTCSCFGEPEFEQVMCPKCGGTGKERLYPQAKRKDGSPYDTGSRTSALYRSGGAFETLRKRGGDGKVETGEPCRKCKGTGQVTGLAHGGCGFPPDKIDDWPTKPAVIVDPFAGRGTVARACRKHGRDWIMIEIGQKYIEMMKRYLEIGDKQIESKEGPTVVQSRLMEYSS